MSLVGVADVRASFPSFQFPRVFVRVDEARVTDGAANGTATQAEFHGPAEMAEKWAWFLTLYTKGGALEHNARSAALLDQVAFGDGARELAKLHSSDPPAYQRFRRAVEDAARSLCDQTDSGAMRPLHKAVVSGLIGRWIALERCHELYPPPGLSASAGVTNGENKAIHRRQSELLRSPEGAVLAGALRLSHERMLRVAAQETYQRHKSRVSYDEVVAQAHDVFDTALFRYQEDHGATFTTWVQGAFKRFLGGVIRRKHVNDRSSIHNMSELPTEDVLPPDSHVLSPVAVLSTAETREQLESALNRLEPRERYILRLRFGLQDGQTHTLEDVAERLDITKEWVRTLQERALKRCRAALSQGNREDNADAQPPQPHGRGR